MLLKLADLAGQAGKEPKGDAFATFEREVQGGQGLTAQDRQVLSPFRSRLHARRVEKAVPGLPGAWGWEGALKECQQVTGTPSLWVLACRVESLAELGRARGQEWDEARRALREGWQKAKAEVGGEESREARAYALALVAWKDDNPGEGAGLLLDAFGTDNVPVVLEQAHRKNRRLPQIVTAAVDGLRNGGTLDRPFKSAESAQLAFGWLELAERVAGGERNRDFNRALAAWHRT
ncbi:MAG TPA: hypothetical protein VKD72_09385, partial [Gemmataceae bacterium]|nr:hypothetical protein [Gemmataceae bacterium]